MNDNKLFSTKILRTAGCIIFDIALLLAFFKIFWIVIIIDPIKFILALFVLLAGLIIFNISLILPSRLFKSIGIPYSISITSLCVLYSLVANVFSLYLIKGKIIWYLVWELILIALFIFAINIIISFSRGSEQENRKSEKENIEKTSVKLKLMAIETAFDVNENKSSLLPSINSFEVLKERIQASTPFGRINGNNSVLDLENQINDNLSFLLEMLKAELTDNNIVELGKIIENTRRLVISRETLNIK